MGCRFIGQNELWFVHQRASDRHSLLLTSGEVRGTVVDALGEPDKVEQFGRPRLRFGARDASKAHRDDYVAPGTQAGDQVEGLKDDSDGLPAVLREGGTAQLGDDG